MKQWDGYLMEKKYHIVLKLIHYSIEQIYGSRTSKIYYFKKKINNNKATTC